MTVAQPIEQLASLSSEEVRALLEEYGAARDAHSLADLIAAVDWATHSPAELLVAIDLALALNLTRLAMRLAREGGALFPEHERVQQAARVIRPAEVLHTQSPPAKGLPASMEWFSQHAAEYRGQWVAVREGKF